SIRSLYELLKKWANYDHSHKCGCPRGKVSNCHSERSEESKNFPLPNSSHLRPTSQILHYVQNDNVLLLASNHASRITFHTFSGHFAVENLRHLRKVNVAA